MSLAFRCRKRPAACGELGGDDVVVGGDVVGVVAGGAAGSAAGACTASTTGVLARHRHVSQL